MGMVPTTLQYLLHLHHKVDLGRRVATLGNQDIWASMEDAKALFDATGNSCSDPGPVRHHSSDYFRRCHPKRSRDFIHAETFFRMMGFEEYVDIDVSDRDGARLIHDLNEPIPEDLKSRFSLVIDAGTTEHIFDTRQVLSSVIGLVEVGGWVFHLCPSSNFIDHGYYSISPCLLYDFYQANGFDHFTCHLAEVDPDDLFEPFPLMKYRYGASLLNVFGPEKQVVTLFAARKMRAMDVPVVPCQGSFKPGATQELELDVPLNTPSRRRPIVDSLLGRLGARARRLSRSRE